MAQHNDLGKQAEVLAETFLSKLNYQVLEKNWRYLKAEIDIIAIDTTTKELIIVEVKALTSNHFKNPENSVTTAKKKRLQEAANAYLEINKLNQEVRFDIISILFSNHKPTINHLVNAFNNYEL